MIKVENLIFSRVILFPFHKVLNNTITFSIKLGICRFKNFFSRLAIIFLLEYFIKLLFIIFFFVSL